MFIFCGLWHGAEWTFLIWGLYHGLLLIIEKGLKEMRGFAIQGVAGKMLTFLFVTLGWVIFRSESVAEMFTMFSKMIGIGNCDSFVYHRFAYFITPQVIVAAITALLLSVFPISNVMNRVLTSSKISIVVGRNLLMMGMLIVSMIFMADASFHAFIYFRF